MHRPTRRAFIAEASVAFTLLARPSPAAELSSSTPVIVDTSDGKLRGVRRGAVSSFKGVPYAADTGGRNRFMAPQPVPKWAGVRDARHFGPRAPQEQRAVEPQASGATPQYSEACCVLNVYTPSIQNRARLPVMVFIHGGGFRSGSGDSPTLDGSRLAESGGVVVVTLNRRLNILGFVNLGLFDDEFADAANAGQLDLVASLKWVQRNIEAFGGDPKRVTLFGVSGGGSAIETLSIMPSARGLFNRTINMSGSSAFAMRPAAEMAPVTETFLKNLAVDKDELRKLQTLPPAQLLAAYNAASRAHGGGDFRPVVDGRLIPYAPLTTGALAIGGHLPGIMSCTATEASSWLANDRRNLGVTREQVQQRLAAQFDLNDGQAATVLAAYRAGDPARTPWDLLVAVATDALVRTPMRRAAEIKADAGLAPVYFSEFNWRSPKDNGIWGAAHGIDVPFAFGTIDQSPLAAATGPDAQAVVRAEMSAFTSLARAGNPNNSAMPAWTPFTTKRRSTMVIDAKSRLVDDYRAVDRRAAELIPSQDAFQIIGGPLFRFSA